MEPYSVLMSIYYKEDSTYFKQSLESILSQTVRTDDLVLVCDGPLTPELLREGSRNVIIVRPLY